MTTSLTLIVVGKKFKVYADKMDARRSLVGTFTNEADAIRFMTNYRR